MATSTRPRRTPTESASPGSEDPVSANPDDPGDAYTDPEPPPAEPEAPQEPAEAPERRPEAAGLEERAKGVFDRLRTTKPADGGPAKPAGKPTKETRPKQPAPRRVSTQDFWADGVEGFSSLFARTGYVPMSRAMAWSSPVAGEIIEDATKGTLIDKGIQPIVRNAEKWQDLFDLIGFWAAIGVAQAQPEKAPMALVFARKRLVNLLPKIASSMAKQRKKEREAAEALATLMPEMEELQLGDDPVTALIEMLFAAPDMAGAPDMAPAA